MYDLSSGWWSLFLFVAFSPTDITFRASPYTVAGSRVSVLLYLADTRANYNPFACPSALVKGEESEQNQDSLCVHF